MVFNRVYLNVDDGEYYVEDIGTAFDDFWNSLNSKGVFGRILYRMTFYTIVNVARLTGRSKKASLDLG